MFIPAKIKSFLKRTVSPVISIVIVGFFSVFAIQMAFAFTGPTQSPPNGNVSAPVNVGTSAQNKSGAFGVGAFSSFGQSYFGGNVGIGTTDPLSTVGYGGKLLHLYGTQPALILENTGGEPSKWEIGTNWFGTPDNNAALTIGNSASGYYLTIQDGGNVGIGATNPGAKLHVSGGNIYETGGDIVFTEDQTARYIRPNFNGGAIRFRSNAGAATDRGIQFGNVDNNLNWLSYMTVDHGGNVGIGTTSPSQKLSVDGTVYSSGGFKFPDGTTQTTAAGAGAPGSSQWTTSGSNIYYNTGNVGIGTPTPGAKLDVNGNVMIESGTAEPSLIWGPNSTTERFRINYTGNLVFYSDHDTNGTADNLAMTVERVNGNVGIGTAAPDYKLHTYRTTTVDNYDIFSECTGAGCGSRIAAQGPLPQQRIELDAINDGANGYGMLQVGKSASVRLEITGNPITLNGANNNKVGIGTTNPGYKLDVNGLTRSGLNIRIGGDGATSVGNANDPAITATGYTNAGLYFENSGVGLGSGSGKMLFLNSSGNVGIGTTDPGTAKLKVAGDYGSGTTAVYGSAASYGVQGYGYGSSGTGVYGTGASYGVYGETSAQNSPGVYGKSTNIGYGVKGENSATSGISYGVYGISVSTDAAAAGVYGSGNYGVYGKSTGGVSTAGVYGESSGGLGYGVQGLNSYSFGSAVYGYSSASFSYGVYGKSTGTNSYGVYCDGRCGGNSGWINTSDARLKKNITTITGALEKVLKLRGVNYAWKDDEQSTNQIGFIAQEVLPIVPEVVGKGPDDYYTLKYAEFTPLLVGAIQEQQKQIEELKVENSELRGRLDNLEAKVNSLLAR